jgi:maltose O-acetyltransferase
MRTEKEKMLTGKLYNAMDAELSRDRLSARQLVYAFNTQPPELWHQRPGLLRELLGEAGQDITIEPPFHCDYGYNIHIGDFFFANFNLVILDCTTVHIGNHVYIGPGVGIYTATHPLLSSERSAGLEYALPVKIGDHVWIGGQVVINPGVNIGDHAVIGSGSVVTRDIPPGVLAAGNPCRVIRSIEPWDAMLGEKDIL